MTFRVRVEFFSGAFPSGAEPETHAHFFFFSLGQSWHLITGRSPVQVAHTNPAAWSRRHGRKGVWQDILHSVHVSAVLHWWASHDVWGLFTAQNIEWILGGSQPWERPSFYTGIKHIPRSWRGPSIFILNTWIHSVKDRYRASGIECFIVFEAKTDRAVVFSWSDVWFAPSFNVTNFWVVLNDFFLMIFTTSFLLFSQIHKTTT